MPEAQSAPALHGWPSAAPALPVVELPVVVVPPLVVVLDVEPEPLEVEVLPDDEEDDGAPVLPLLAPVEVDPLLELEALLVLEVLEVVEPLPLVEVVDVELVEPAPVPPPARCALLVPLLPEVALPCEPTLPLVGALPHAARSTRLNMAAARMPGC